VRERRPVPDVIKEIRVRGAFAVNPALRGSSEVQVSSVSNGVVHLVGVPGGSDTSRAALVAARVPGVASVEVHDKVTLADGDAVGLSAMSIG
jgi:osmotically-inducible protein OsmY